MRRVKETALTMPPGLPVEPIEAINDGIHAEVAEVLSENASPYFRHHVTWILAVEALESDELILGVNTVSQILMQAFMRAHEDWGSNILRQLLLCFIVGVV